MIDIADLASPVEVWKAVEGDPSELIALLRSGDRLSTPVREALADYLEGSLSPVKRPKGRPPKDLMQPYFMRASAASYGHDVTTELGIAGFRYEHYRRFIRRKGWHKKNAGNLYWSAARLREKIAERQELELEKFVNYLNRPKPKHKKWDHQQSMLRARIQIADEIHHRKKREND